MTPETILSNDPNVIVNDVYWISPLVISTESRDTRAVLYATSGSCGCFKGKRSANLIEYVQPVQSSKLPVLILDYLRRNDHVTIFHDQTAIDASAKILPEK